MHEKGAGKALDLGRWLGRRPAFALVAGRCSATDTECLRQARQREQHRASAVGLFPVTPFTGHWHSFRAMHRTFVTMTCRPDPRPSSASPTKLHAPLRSRAGRRHRASARAISRPLIAPWQAGGADGLPPATGNACHTSSLPGRH